MSRCITLEEYLNRFVDENTRSAREDVTLVVTDEQAQTLGFFLINGLAGFVEYVRLERDGPDTSALSDEGTAESQGSNEQDHEEFIN